MFISYEKAVNYHKIATLNFHKRNQPLFTFEGNITQENQAPDKTYIFY